MKKVNIVSIIIFILFTSVLSFAQLTKVVKPNVHDESDIYLSTNGTKYSNLITLKFNKHVLDENNLNVNNIDINTLLLQDVKNYFSSLKKKYGNFTLIKSCPLNHWGDTTVVNKQSMKTVVVPDLSQLIKIKFDNNVPIDSIVNDLNSQSFIKYAEGPKEVYLCTTPNDPLYSSASHWAFDKILAEKAWDITTGSSTVLIGINDLFTVTTLHTDLTGKIAYSSQGLYENHGGSVAGIAGAVTNNSTGIASLGWNVRLILTAYANASEIDLARTQGANIINFSWMTLTNYSDIHDAVYRAISNGVICVAAAGNDEYTPPYLPYPAAYNFGSTGKVIAVSGTTYDGTTESFVDGWNYSPGTDPISDPTNSFIDVAAPGDKIEILVGTGYSPDGRGTSDSAPFVSALCGLILSINSSITPNQMHTIIQSTADKIGQYSYNSNGWNRYMGYGRINAYNALKYTLEHYGGTLSQSFSIPAGETWTFDPGVVLNFANGVTLTVNGTFNVIGSPTDPITINNGSIIFSGSGASSSVLNYVNINNGSGIQCLNTGNVTIENSKLSYCTNGIYVYNSYPTIEYNQILEPQQNGIYGQSSYSFSVTNNTITKTTASGSYYHNYQGLYFYSNSPVYVNQNDVSGFYWGGYFGGGSNVTLHDFNYNNPHPYNRFTNNLFGIGSAWGSTINMTWAKSAGSGNSVYNNTYYDIDCDNSSYAYAQNTYWGGGEPTQYVDGTSYLIVDPVLTTDPWASGHGGLQPAIASVNTNIKPADLNSATASTSNVSPGQPLANDNLSDINLGLQLENDNQISQAMIHYQSLISSDRLVNFSLTELKNIRGRHSGNNIEAYFQSLIKSNKYGAIASKLLGDSYLQDGKFDDAMNAYDNVIQNFPTNYQAVNAKFDKLFAYLNIKQDNVTAEKILTELKQMNLQNEELKMRLDVAENLLNGTSNINSASKAQVEDNTLNNTVPHKYFMYQNYPNPFNPTTVITYQIPNNGFVSLKVYDMLGIEVKTLVNEFKSQGRYSVSFDASHLASGVYFYQLRSGNYSSIKKMVLLK